MKRFNFKTSHVRLGLAASCVALFGAAAAIGQTAGPGSVGSVYSYNDLDAYWQNTVGTQTLTALTTQTINSAVGSLPPLASSTGGGGGRRGRLPPPVGTGNPDAGATGQTLYFNWQLPSSPTLDSDMMAREVTLATFVTMADSYVPATISGSSNSVLANQQAAIAIQQQTQTVRIREYEAQIELFLIAAMRYYAADAIADKCERVKQMQRLLARIDTLGLPDTPGSPAVPVLPDSRFATLQQTAIAFVRNPVTVDGQQTTFRAQIGAGTACLVTEVSSVDEDLAMAAQAMDNDIIADLQAPAPQGSEAGMTLRGTLDAIQGQLSTWAQIQDQLKSLDPHAKELLDLELRVANDRDNLGMVENDMLGAKQALDAMLAKLKSNGLMTADGGFTNAGVIANLSAVVANPDAGPGTLGPLAQLNKQLGALQGALAAYITALQSAATAVPQSLQNGALAGCANLDVGYANHGGDAGPIVACMNALNTVVSGAAATTPFQQQLTAVGNAAQDLSRLVICQRQNIAPVNCPAN